MLNEFIFMNITSILVSKNGFLKNHNPKINIYLFFNNPNCYNNSNFVT